MNERPYVPISFIKNSDAFRIALEAHIRFHTDKITPKFLYVLLEHPELVSDFMKRNKEVAPGERVHYSEADKSCLREAVTRDFSKKFDEPKAKLDALESRRRFLFAGAVTLVTAGISAGLQALQEFHEAHQEREKRNQRMKTLNAEIRNEDVKVLLQKVEEAEPEITARTISADEHDKSGQNLGVVSILMELLAGLTIPAIIKTENTLEEGRTEIERHQRDVRYSTLAPDVKRLGTVNKPQV
jgi:hypothetical protein